MIEVLFESDEYVQEISVISADWFVVPLSLEGIAEPPSRDCDWDAVNTLAHGPVVAGIELDIPEELFFELELLVVVLLVGDFVEPLEN